MSDARFMVLLLLLLLFMLLFVYDSFFFNNIYLVTTLLMTEYLHFTWRKNKNNIQESFFVYDSLGTTEWNWNRGLYDKYAHVALFCQNNQVQQYI